MSGVSGNNESTSLLEHLNSTVRTVQPSMSQSVQRYLMSAQLLLNQVRTGRQGEFSLKDKQGFLSAVANIFGSLSRLM